MKLVDLLFRRTVREIMLPAPAHVPAGTPCGVIARILCDSDAKIVLIEAPDGAIEGQVALEDVPSWLAARAGPDTPVEAVMTTLVDTIGANEELFRAFLRLRGRRRCLLVMDEGRPVGVLEPGAAMAEFAQQFLPPAAADIAEVSLLPVRELRRFQATLVGRLLDAGEPVQDVLGAVTAISGSILKEILSQTLADMASEGWGKPPVEFTVIALGSWGRGECNLASDQDIGFILAPYPDDAHVSVDRFFIKVADRLTRDLDQVGIPYCPGDVMPINPLWRKTLPQWRDQIAGWCRSESPQAVRFFDIFFDFQPIAGPAEMARELRQFVTDRLRNNRRLLSAMWADEAESPIGRRAFGGFQTLRHPATGSRRINLKHGLRLQLVGAVRILALRDGVEASGTPERIEALCARSTISAAERADLLQAFELVSRLLLRQQIEDLTSRGEAGSWLDPAALMPPERVMLAHSMRAVDRFRRRVRADITGAIL